MTGPSFERVKQLVGAARDLPPAARQAYLAEACGDDPALRREVESLLDAGARMDGFLATPAASPADAPPLPERIGRYRILGRLGTGGMGLVLEAEQDSPRRRVALKMVAPGFATDQVLQRFRREADLLGRLHHPGVAQIHDAGRVDLGGGPQPYFVMELVRGLPITRHAEQRRLDVPARLELFAAVCDAVQHAHERGVLHRDLKPANILVTDEPERAGSGQDDAGRPALGRPKVLDFGVGRAIGSEAALSTLRTSTGQLVGTLPYMSPEQVSGGADAVDARSDVYALGVLLFELLTGRLPHGLAGRTLPEAARIIREDEPTRPASLDTTLRGDLDTILLKALEKEPRRRYGSAAALAADVRRHLRHEPIAARPASALYQLRKFTRRHRGLVAGLALAAAALITGLLLAVRFALGEAEQRRASDRARAEARFATYRASLAAAVASADPVVAAGALDEAPAEHRGWEHAHLLARTDPVLADFVAPDAPPDATLASAVAWPGDAGPLLTWLDAGAVRRVRLVDGAVRSWSTDVAGRARHVASSADATRIAAAIDDGEDGDRLLVWTLGQAARADTLLDLALDGRCEALALDTAGRRVAVHASQGGTLVLDVDTGAVERSAEFEDPGLRLDFLPDGGELVLTSRRHGLRLLERDGPKWLAGAVFSALAIGPRGAYIARPDNPGITILPIATPQQATPLGTGFVPTWAMDWSADGRLLAFTRDRRIQVWDITDRALAHSLPLRDTVVPEGGSLLLAPDGSALLARTARGARLWSLGTQAVQVLDDDQSYVYEAVFSADGRLLATAGSDGEVRLRDAATLEVLARLPTGLQDVKGLAFSPDGQRLVCVRNRSLLSWDLTLGPTSLQTGGPPAGAPPGDPVRHPYWRQAAGGAVLSVDNGAVPSYASTPDGRQVVQASKAGARVVDLATGQEVWSTMSGPDGGRAAVGVSADGGLLAIGHADGSITLLDAASGRSLATLRGHAGRVYGLGFHPDGTRLASGGRDGTIRIWDLQHHRELVVLHGHRDYVHSVRFSPDGSRLVSASGDGTVRLWDALPLAERSRRTRAWQATLEALALAGDGGPVDGEVLAGLGADPGFDEQQRAAAVVLSVRRAWSTR